jgi:hypothetical protein
VSIVLVRLVLFPEFHAAELFFALATLFGAAWIPVGTRLVAVLDAYSEVAARTVGSPVERIRRRVWSFKGIGWSVVGIGPLLLITVFAFSVLVMASGLRTHGAAEKTRAFQRQQAAWVAQSLRKLEASVTASQLAVLRARAESSLAYETAYARLGDRIAIAEDAIGVALFLACLAWARRSGPRLRAALLVQRAALRRDDRALLLQAAVAESVRLGFLPSDRQEQAQSQGRALV